MLNTKRPARYTSVALAMALSFTLDARALLYGADAILQVDQARTNCDSRLKLEHEPKVVWRQHGTNVIPAGDLLYSVDRQQLSSCRASDGTLLRYANCPAYAAPLKLSLVMADVAYFLTEKYVVAINTSNGNVVWTRETGSQGFVPVMIGDLLVFMAEDGLVYAFDAKSGVCKWTVDLLKDAPPSPPGFDARRGRIGADGARPRMPATDGKTLFQPIFDQSRIVAINCETAQVKWSFQTKGWIYGNPVVTEKYVYIGSKDRRLYCLDRETGLVKWDFHCGFEVEAAAAVQGDAVFFGSLNGSVYRLNAETGKMIWKFKCDYVPGHGAPIYDPPLLGGGLVYVATLYGQLYGLDAANGELKWKIGASDSERIEGLMTNGKLLFLSKGGELLAFGDAD